MKPNTELDPIPEHFASIEEAVEFWDTHDTADYEAYLKEVQPVNLNLKTITREVKFEPEVALKVAKLAKAKGVSFSDLINFWVKEKLNDYPLTSEQAQKDGGEQNVQPGDFKTSGATSISTSPA